MKARTRNKVLAIYCTLLCIALCLLVFVECKNGGGSGGSGGGRGGGFSRGGRSSGGRISNKKIALGAAAVGGVGAYAAYKHHQNQDSHRFHSNPLENLAFKSGGGARVDDFEEDYKLQESSYYNRGEGFGMSALGIILIILGIIGLCTLIHYCIEIGVPLWKDRQRNRNRQSLYTTKEGHPLQETPSTATPSP